ncbi:hypothetical protein [Sphingomonas xinjiangensis]|uniref:Uncharacterized protein n=1 Tax=Sphingomonas xinjiangensis TaxID=643568 RepID=A0A840YK60_9SPHN|nr:hypothetical protein [Sphingomonas xinjiangensis]MBB5709320.1 hypothetical protein [Sphingomonas xinjiangensis]
MSEPYTAAMITTVLRGSTDDRLGQVRPTDFHRWPTRKIVPRPLIEELIRNERARRVGC